MKTHFHLALPCHSITETRDFYVNRLGAPSGRETEKWLDIDLYGHQITFTKAGDFKFQFKDYRLGEHILPSFHYGVILDRSVWTKLYERFSKDNDLDVTTEVSFMSGNVGEHLSFFLKDPNGYTIEFKSFERAEEIFLSVKE